MAGKKGQPPARLTYSRGHASLPLASEGSLHTELRLSFAMETELPGMRTALSPNAKFGTCSEFIPQSPERHCDDEVCATRSRHLGCRRRTACPKSICYRLLQCTSPPDLNCASILYSVHNTLHVNTFRIESRIRDGKGYSPTTTTARSQLSSTNTHGSPGIRSVKKKITEQLHRVLVQVLI
jgi:hypothetical protein